MKDICIPGFVTVRASSTRLPNKCFLPFGDDCSVLEHIIRRAKYYGIDPIVCTSTDLSDDAIATIAKKECVRVFRGSLVNKLKRWSDCAKYFNIDAFHTVDADDPFFDGREMQRSFQFLKDGDWDVVCPTERSSAGGASVGYTLTSNVVKCACANLSQETDTEMMWYHLDRVPGLKKINLSDISRHFLKLRLTLDYQEDYWLLESVRRIVGNLASRETVEELFVRNPDMHKINWFRNEEWKAGQLAKSL